MKKIILFVFGVSVFSHASAYLNSWLILLFIAEPVLNLDIDMNVGHNTAIVLSPELMMFYTWDHDYWTATSLGLGVRKYITFKDGQMTSNHLENNSFSIFAGIHAFPSFLSVNDNNVHSEYTGIAPEVRLGTMMKLETLFQVSVALGYNFTDFDGDFPLALTPNTAIADGFYYRINFCVGFGDF